MPCFTGNCHWPIFPSCHCVMSGGCTAPLGPQKNCSVRVCFGNDTLLLAQYLNHVWLLSPSLHPVWSPSPHFTALEIASFFFETVNWICIYQLNLQHLNSDQLCSTAQKKSPNLLLSHWPSAHHEDYQQFLSLSALTPTLLSLAHDATLQHAAHKSPHLNNAPAAQRDPGTKMAISPTAAPNLISMEIGLSVRRACMHPF